MNRVTKQGKTETECQTKYFTNVELGLNLAFVCLRECNLSCTVANLNGDGEQYTLLYHLRTLRRLMHTVVCVAKRRPYFIPVTF